MKNLYAIQSYIESVAKRYATGISTEHSYRVDLQNLIAHFCPDLTITNEPKRQACGAPDFIVTKKSIPVGYIEAKDIGKDLDDKSLQEQFDRYRQSLDNLIITDYLQFRFYRLGEEKARVNIGDIENKKIVPIKENLEKFATLIRNFCIYRGQTIKSSKKLSEMMAIKARLLANVIASALQSDEKTEANSTLKEQLEAFRKILIHDIGPKEFADIYAQTIAYGMFAARLHDPTLEDFSRQEAAELIPKSNPFLRSLFGYIAGPDIDDRIRWIVDDLADIFRATDVKSLLKGFGTATAQTDPMLHFYETFLGHYDKKLKKSRGVWYTPEPVVGFIVRSVDHLLKSKFNLSDGLVDTSKITIKIKSSQGGDRRYADGYKRIEKEIHKVQILDPAAGTGTFLADILKQIYRNFEGMQGIWSEYVKDHLIPRLNGFEILMASYAMAHLKMELLLSETGYNAESYQRLRIFLTNSLEAYHPDTGTLFATWLAREAEEANKVKRDTPVMVVLGNPPYSGHSANKGEWIAKLLEDYKQEPGGGRLREKNPKWLNDDYVKFIRYGQYYIERNGEGILAYINPHGYLDNPTFRGMRYNLLQTFDEIYVLDLHGNANKKERAPDGGKDENVFDIKQGVSINIFVKMGKKPKGKLAKVYHHELYGLRKSKYDYLDSHSVASVDYTELKPKAPQYYFMPKDEEAMAKYQLGFALNELFPVNSVGIVTSRDSLVIAENKKELIEKIKTFFEHDENYLKNILKLKENKSWKIAEVKKRASFNEKFIYPISYRPFDDRYIYYDTENFIERGREKVMRHMLVGENIGLLISRQGEEANREFYDTVSVTSKIVDLNYFRRGGVILLPIYRYPEESSLSKQRSPNLNKEILSNIEKSLGLHFVPEKSEEPNTFAPIDLLDYIYAVLHSPSYRQKYAEFLKSDFPRVPYPDNKKLFWRLVELGSRLRQIHLLESKELSPPIITYPIDGNCQVQPKNVPRCEVKMYHFETKNCYRVQ
ncbi:adenine specific DNA methyltransferase [Nitratiruptor sp. YY08-26]|uniref:type ISP restriction/modification enzyme n=1 Tax=unclassified Nitratiruptor TaxID=2624044 RepID=UPI0019155F13|nr:MULTISPECIES: type ISP restriction/modification enzyme [unclassified Nitratiruptor]BCD61627.1 adenine specific DNA methyltransferase [Nitratiruptor sp. YY08-13]BCD65561.1 adenine specific DNA methyltransferase [Nitratiruptor sp. YY08-26]